MQISLGRKVLSYFYPLVLRTYDSKYSGKLELGLQNGKLVLDSKNANYSFGNLHTLFQKAINKLTLTKTKKYNTLILGFGVGSIARILEKRQNHQFNITGIEIDETIISIGTEYFDTSTIKDCKIVEQDALQFVESTSKKYDLIFIDLFIDTKVPSPFMTTSFLSKTKELLTPSGNLMMNIMDNKEDTTFNASWNKIFNDKGKSNHYNLLGTNTIFHYDNKL